MRTHRKPHLTHWRKASQRLRSRALPENFKFQLRYIIPDWNMLNSKVVEVAHRVWETLKDMYTPIKRD
jgi:hypothetical protein